tara:strand:+ start:5740 stop:6687 length:948 start_codon:yes stop_codon:yes gene_type:complete
MISLQEYKDFYEKSLKHNFDNSDSIFIDQFKLNRNIYFGFNKLKNLIIILPKNIYQTTVGIKNICMLSSPQKFISLLDNSFSVYGCPLIYTSNMILEQYEMLTHINDLLELNDYPIQINRFLNILESLNLKNNNFKSSGFFAEACLVDSLLDNYPNIADHWISTRNSAFDIKSSKNNPDIEIKSTLNDELREHKISINQIQAFKSNKNAELASLIVFREENGISCNDICKKIMLRIEKSGVGYSNIFNLLISFSKNSDFNNNRFNLIRTRKTIKIIRPDFSSFILDPQPVWLKGGSLNIDFELINSLGSNLKGFY